MSPVATGRLIELRRGRGTTEATEARTGRLDAGGADEEATTPQRICSDGMSHTPLPVFTLTPSYMFTRKQTLNYRTDGM